MALTIKKSINIFLFHSFARPSEVSALLAQMDIWQPRRPHKKANESLRALTLELLGVHLASGPGHLFAPVSTVRAREGRNPSACASIGVRAVDEEQTLSRSGQNMFFEYELRKCLCERGRVAIHLALPKPVRPQLHSNATLTLSGAGVLRRDWGARGRETNDCNRDR